MKKLYIFLTLLTGFLCEAQIINFPDPVFKAKLLAASPSTPIASVPMDPVGYVNVKIDTNDNGEIEQSEAALIYNLNIAGSGITDVTGINYFYNLRVLHCNGNNLTALNISNLTFLERLDCKYNQIASIQFAPVISEPTNRYMWLYCENNALTSLDLSMFSHITQLSLQNNQLTGIDLSHLTELNFVVLSFNPIVSFHHTVPPNSYLDNFQLSSNTLVDFYYDATQANGGVTSVLNVGGDNLTNVSILYSPDTNGFVQFTDVYGPVEELNIVGGVGMLNLYGITSETLDLSQCRAQSIALSASQTKYLNMKNGLVSQSSIFGNENTQLEYVCCDEGEISILQTSADGWGESAQINTYCSFTPGGTFYTINGDVRYDLNSNGCDATDMEFPFIRFDITDGTNVGGMITDNSGHYQMAVHAATHTITPDLENQTYFSVSPSSVTVTFPADASPNINDFCVTANGAHTDIEIALVPLNAARPGFDSFYKLIYKNKGTVAASGTINFNYGNNVEFVSANPNVSSQGTQVLNWNYTDLQPFEQREIEITMNVNAPTDIPAVNDGDILNYSASGATDIADELPADNQALLNQFVFNSFDPNDKTCLEGDAIEPDMVGKYVHYQIRFENSGTANAENIVVKDMIDTNKFEINSLIPIDGSHDFYTRINGNKVEFIFENIQLPFDDANNDGYVMFKIKTKPTLVLGDTFSNSASIYFDYNHPIVTDPAVTTISVLATKDFEFSDYFTIYPNPASKDLNIQKKNDLKISSMEIYNILGQLVIAIPNAQEVSKVDVSSLTSGNYFIKINSDKGTTNAKFAKN